MAYMNQERKKELSVWINEVLKKYNMKGTLSVRNHSWLVCTLKSWIINFQYYLTQKAIDKWYYENWYMRVSEYNIEDQFEWIALDFLLELRSAMMKWNHDNSDIMTDYFDVGWYIDINIGDYDKPYIII